MSIFYKHYRRKKKIPGSKAPLQTSHNLKDCKAHEEIVQKKWIL